MHKYGRWVVVIVVACGAWLCWRLFAREHTTREERAPLTVAQRETRLQLGLTNIAAHERARLAGRVHERGAGITGALICASCVACEATSAPDAQCTHSGDGGQYAFSELAAGGYFIAASATGYGPGSAHDGEPVYLAEGQASIGIDIAL
ncbi:MAG TPA: carboxypeptidase-like regulatory domain-containing protein, partial [Polyangiales bacterium]|nr:carboxypeptidase-like regulatory domain-containing protein [Polyangiales bacterium]